MEPQSTASWMAEQAAAAVRAAQASKQPSSPPEEEMNGELFEEEQAAEPQSEMVELHGIADEAAGGDPDAPLADQEPAEEADEAQGADASAENESGGPEG